MCLLRYPTCLPPVVVVVIATGLAGPCLVCKALLPKPLPGNPCNKTSLKRLLGDVPDITAHASAFDNNTIITMTLAFWNNMVVPKIYRQEGRVVNLWHTKRSIADGRLWAADEDVRALGLDAVMGFVYGDVFGSQVTVSSINAVKVVSEEGQQVNRSNTNDVVVFPEGRSRSGVGVVEQDLM
ncbi:hypothetical protein BDV12DRAFT_203000 [Aspergillus spectabilis]